MLFQSSSEQSERNMTNRREAERVMFPLLFCSFEPRRGKCVRERCNRPLYISGQMRGLRVLLFCVRLEERNRKEQKEHYNSYTLNLQFMYLCENIVCYIICLCLNALHFHTSKFCVRWKDPAWRQMKGYLKDNKSVVLSNLLIGLMRPDHFFMINEYGRQLVSFRRQRF